MKATLLGFFITQIVLGSSAFAHDLDLKYAASVSVETKKIVESAMEEVASLLPNKLKLGLPKNIEISVSNLTNHKVIPDEVCGQSGAPKPKDGTKAFVYGQYNQYKNVLTINTPVLLELKSGTNGSKRINCQHKSLYEQAIATMVHELTHAYDFNNGRISNSMEYIRRAGFKKGLLKIKNKNLEAMRSADPYELVNIAESFAVNMEYFAMDSEFKCRKPSMFDFFKNLFEVDPFPNRTCNINNSVMMSTASGYFPIKLDTSRVYRIDYLLASKGKEAMSGFGHAMFRIIVCAPERIDPITNRKIPATPFGKKCLEDKMFHLVISYRANVEDATLSYMKGLFGGYPSMLFVLNFSDVLDEYNRDELRDIISYPLKLSVKEREDFVMKVIEEHWNYRGAYKFINNNCAVESYDLLKSALERSQLNKKSSLTPNGVLEDLDKMEFLSISDKDIETYKAKTEQIILAYSEAYGYKSKNDKADKAAIQKFIDESTMDQRMNRFLEFKKTKIPNNDLNTEVTLLKERLVIASSFSVMEQQIIRTLALKYRKSAADKFMNSKDEKIKELVKNTGKAFNQSFRSLSKDGYGIPSQEEMISPEELANNATNSKEVIDEADKILREIMPKEFETLEKMNTNIQTYSQYSLNVRKEFRAKLDLYIHEVLKNLTKGDYTKEVLVSAANGNPESLIKVRELLGKTLVTEKEILDVKLKKIIQELI